MKQPENENGVCQPASKNTHQVIINSKREVMNMNRDTYNIFPVISKGKIGDEQIQTVNARDLHSFLENGELFATWIKDKIETYNFIENQDFISFLENTKKPKGGRPAKEYAISIDMAKELSMVERNEKGKQARQYFIECERRAKNIGLLNNNLKSQTPAMVREARLQYKLFAGIAKTIGLNGNQAILSAATATKTLTGVDMLGAMQVTHIDAANKNPDLTPTTIASRIGIKNAREVNNLLTMHGYQIMYRDHKGNPYYELTEKGLSSGGVYKDTGKKHSNGTPVKQLMWSSQIIDCLMNDINVEAAE